MRPTAFPRPRRRPASLCAALVLALATASALAAPTTPAGERVLHRTISTGASFGSATLRQELGLGDATAITRVELFWPVTGQIQTITGLDLDHAYRIREGDATASPLALKSFRLPLAPPPAGAAYPHH